MARTSAFMLCACIFTAQALVAAGTDTNKVSTSRKLLSNPVDSLLMDVLCAADQVDAVVDQFLGLNNPLDLGGLPAILGSVTDLTNKIEGKLENVLGIKPPASCSKVAKAPTLDDIVKTVYCTLETIDGNLEKALGLSSPKNSGNIVTVTLSQLLAAVGGVEDDLVKFATGITCS